MNKKKQESLTVSKIVQKCLKQLFLLITKFNFFADHQYLQSYLEIAKTKYILYNNNSWTKYILYNNNSWTVS